MRKLSFCLKFQDLLTMLSEYLLDIILFFFLMHMF